MTTAEFTCRYKRKTSLIKFTWIIEDFLSWCNTHSKIKSPIFPEDGDHRTKWQLHFHPQLFDRQSDETKMLLQLHPFGKMRDDVNIKAHFQILPNEEVMPLLQQEAGDSFYQNRRLNFFWVKRNPRSYYPDGNLTTMCSIEVDHFTCLNEGAVVKKPQPDYDCWKHYFDSKYLSDVTFIVDESEYPAHKIILATASPVFQAMFRKDAKECSSSKLHIPDVEAEVFHEMMRYMYTGKVENLKTMAPALMAAAEKYQLVHLLEMCADAL